VGLLRDQEQAQCTARVARAGFGREVSKTQRQQTRPECRVCCLEGDSGIALFLVVPIRCRIMIGEID
jgi:hypothetical protein